VVVVVVVVVVVLRTAVTSPTDFDAGSWSPLV